jgi:hypothetical protein
MPPSDEKLIAVLAVSEWRIILKSLETILALQPALHLPIGSESPLAIRQLLKKLQDSLQQFSESVNRPNE